MTACLKTSQEEEEIREERPTLFLVFYILKTPILGLLRSMGLTGTIGT